MRNDSQIIDEIEEIKLDSDLKAKLKDAKMKLEMEKARLKRQSEYDKIISELNSTSTRGMDSIFLSNINLNGSYNNRNSTQQERNLISGINYSEEEKQQAQKRIQKV